MTMINTGWPKAPTLEGRFVRLEPLTPAHGDGFLEAGAEWALTPDHVREGIATSLRRRAIRDIAGLLSALRAIPVADAHAWGVVEDDPRPGYTEDLELARSQVYPLVEPSVRDYIERLFDTYLCDDALLDYEPALLHADLAPDHLRYSPAVARITGVIDWGDASIGDPDYELSYLYRAGGAGFVEEVVRHGPRRDRTKLERKLRFFAGHDTIDRLLTAMQRGNSALVTAGLARLRADVAR
jgi:aminoglycoside 2''-phosphotransferase